MKFRVRAFLSFFIILSLVGCSSLDVNENAWARCSASGTAIITLVTLGSGGNVAAGSILGGANSSLACFLVYEKDGFNTGKDSFAEIRAEKNAAKLAKKKIKTPELEKEVSSSNVASMPVVPLLPVIPSMPVLTEENQETVVAMPVFDEEAISGAEIASVLPVVDETGSESVDGFDYDQKLVFDGSIGTSENPLFIYFEGVGLEVDKEGKDFIEQLVVWLESNPEAEIELIGHSDVDGTASYNLQLSLQRAEEVMALLIAAGIDEFRVIMDYRGSEQQVAPNDTEENRALNRRVEVIWM